MIQLERRNVFVSSLVILLLQAHLAKAVPLLESTPTPQAAPSTQFLVPELSAELPLNDPTYIVTIFNDSDTLKTITVTFQGEFSQTFDIPPNQPPREIIVTTEIDFGPSGGFSADGAGYSFVRVSEPSSLILVLCGLIAVIVISRFKGKSVRTATI
jgi:hypothetical protein